MQIAELLGRRLSEAKELLQGQRVVVKVSGLARQPIDDESDKLRVVRARRTVDGFELLVVLPPVLKTGC